MMILWMPVPVISYELFGCEYLYWMDRKCSTQYFADGSWQFTDDTTPIRDRDKEGAQNAGVADVNTREAIFVHTDCLLMT